MENSEQSKCELSLMWAVYSHAYRCSFRVSHSQTQLQDTRHPATAFRLLQPWGILSSFIRLTISLKTDIILERFHFPSKGANPG